MGTLLYGTLLAAILCTSCSARTLVSEAAGGSQTAGKKAETRQPTPPTTELVTVQDPMENAYTIGMPKGWANRTYSARVFDIHSTVDITVSPNGSVMIFAGDPSIPQYWSPQAANEMTYQFARLNPKMRIEPFKPAEAFFPEYVKRKFGKLPNFKITSAEPDTDLQEKLQARFIQAGVNLRATAARVAFSYTEGGTQMNALVMGQCSDGGSIWIPTVCGISTIGDPLKYVPMIDAIGKTRKTNPQWQAQQQQKHQEAMAQIQRFGQMLTEQHNQNMAWIQQSAQRHQMRMQAIQAQGDASTKAFNDRMAAGDSQQRSFLNYINDENTVASSSGKTFQVDNSYQRYFMHKQNNTYIGGDIRMDLDKLRQFNLNPDDYEEVKIVK